MDHTHTTREYLRNTMEVLVKLKMDPAPKLEGIYSTSKNLQSHKNLQINVHSSFTCNSQNLETIELFHWVNG